MVVAVEEKKLQTAERDVIKFPSSVCRLFWSLTFSRHFRSFNRHLGFAQRRQRLPASVDVGAAALA
jgi:hypothetical protein